MLNHIKKSNANIFCILFTIISSNQPSYCTTEVPQTPNHEIKIDFNHSQKIEIEQKEPIACNHLGGRAVAECFSTLCQEQKIRTLSRIRVDKRRQLLKNITYREYAKFVNDCTDSEWEEFYKSLSFLEKESAPATLAQAKEGIKSIVNVSFGDNAAISGVVGVFLPPVALTLMALEALSLATGRGSLIYGRLLNYNLQDYFDHTFYKYF